MSPSIKTDSYELLIEDNARGLGEYNSVEDIRSSTKLTKQTIVSHLRKHYAGEPFSFKGLIMSDQFKKDVSDYQKRENIKPLDNKTRIIIERITKQAIFHQKETQQIMNNLTKQLMSQYETINNRNETINSQNLKIQKNISKFEKIFWILSFSGIVLVIYIVGQLWEIYNSWT